MASNSSGTTINTNNPTTTTSDGPVVHRIASTDSDDTNNNTTLLIDHYKSLSNALRGGGSDHSDNGSLDSYSSSDDTSSTTTNTTTQSYDSIDDPEYQLLHKKLSYLDMRDNRNNLSKGQNVLSSSGEDYNDNHEDDDNYDDDDHPDNNPSYDLRDAHSSINEYGVPPKLLSHMAILERFIVYPIESNNDIPSTTDNNEDTNNNNTTSSSHNNNNPSTKQSLSSSTPTPKTKSRIVRNTVHNINTTTNTNNNNNHIGKKHNFISPTASASHYNLEEEFIKILRDERACRLLRDFMKGSHANENLTFWLEIEQFKRFFSPNYSEPNPSSIDTSHINNPHDNNGMNNNTINSEGFSLEETQVLLGREAVRIYVKYFTKNSEYEINVTAKEKKELEEKLRSPNANTFDAVQNEIFGLMAMDSFPKFLRSEAYKNFIKDLEKDEKKHKLSSLNIKKAYNSLRSSKNRRELKEEEMKRKRASTIVFEDYLFNLEKDQQQTQQAQSNVLVCHVNIWIPGKPKWKIVQFDKEETVRQGAKRIMEVIGLPDEDVNNYLLTLSKNKKGTLMILDHQRKLSSYDIKEHDCLVFKNKPHLGRVDLSKGNYSGIGEIRLIAIKGEEPTTMQVNFQDPIIKILSMILGKYNHYKPSNSSYNLIWINGKEEVELDMTRSLNDHNVPPNAIIVLKKHKKHRREEKPLVIGMKNMTDGSQSLARSMETSDFFTSSSLPHYLSYTSTTTTNTTTATTSTPSSPSLSSHSVDFKGWAIHMFPSLDESLINKVIADSNYNYNHALETLLSIKSSSSTTTTTSTTTTGTTTTSSSSSPPSPSLSSSSKVVDVLGYPSVEDMTRTVTSLQHTFELQQLNTSTHMLQSMFGDLEEMKNLMMTLELNERSQHLKERLLQMVSASESKLMKGIKPLYLLQQAHTPTTTTTTMTTTTTTTTK